MSTQGGNELQVVILGAGGTGKTALVRKFIHSSFSEGSDSSITQGSNKQIDVDGRPFTLDVVAAEPSTEYQLCQSGQAFILLYAIDNKSSLQQIRQQHEQLKAAKNLRLSSTPIFLVGAKADLEPDRQVPTDEARQLALQLRCQKLFEISALNHTDEINDLFTKLVRQYLVITQQATNAPMHTRPPMTPVASTPKAMSSTPTSPITNDDSPRRSSVFDRLKLGSLKRKASLQSLTRKKSGSFSESIMSLGSARPSRDNVRSVSYGPSSTISQGDVAGNGGSRSYYSNVTVPRRSTGGSSLSGSPYRLDVNTSAWRDTIKWPTEIIPEEDLLAK